MGPDSSYKKISRNKKCLLRWLLRRVPEKRDDLAHSSEGGRGGGKKDLLPGREKARAIISLPRTAGLRRRKKRWTLVLAPNGGKGRGREGVVVQQGKKGIVVRHFQWGGKRAFEKRKKAWASCNLSV